LSSSDSFIQTGSFKSTVQIKTCAIFGQRSRVMTAKLLGASLI